MGINQSVADNYHIYVLSSQWIFQKTNMADRKWLKNFLVKKFNPYRTQRPSFEEKSENDFAVNAAAIFQQKLLLRDYITNLRVDKETFFY